MDVRLILRECRTPAQVNGRETGEEIPGGKALRRGGSGAGSSYKVPRVFRTNIMHLPAVVLFQRIINGSFINAIP